MKDLFSLKNKVVLLTGASGYLGKSICWSLMHAGAIVLANIRSEESLSTIIERERDSQGSIVPAIFDVADIDAIDQWFESYTGQMDVIVNNAYSGSAGTIETSKASDYSAAFDISIVGPNRIIQRALPLLQKSDLASVINIASIYGIISPDLRIYDSPASSNPPFYGAAKAAIIQWTKYAAVEFGARGIRVNSISPGPFPNEDVLKSSPDFVNHLVNKVPMGRVGHSKEIGGPVIFLASSASSFVNGCNLIVDGGWTAW